jgi:hypothetical protein
MEKYEDLIKMSSQTDSEIKLTPENEISDNEVVYNTDNGQIKCNAPSWTGWYRARNGDIYIICKNVNTGYRVWLPGGSTHSWGVGYTWTDVKSAYGVSGVTAYQSRCGGVC